MKRATRTHDDALADDARLRLAGAWPPPGVTVLRRWIAHGLPCMTLTGPSAINGYVWVPPGHPDLGRSYDNVPVDIHGGLTFTIPDLGGRWFGFDTDHLGDYRADANPAGRRWTKDEVAAETERLAEQLAARFTPRP